jgi:hypothetical protein
MFVSLEKANKMQKEALMNTSNTITADSHPRSIIQTLKSNNGLPFRDILSSEAIPLCQPSCRLYL